MKLKMLLLTLASTACISTYSQTMSEDERLFVVNYLERTQSDLLQLLDSIDEQTWSRLPADGGWSVAQIVEHIVIVEEALFKGTSKALSQTSEFLDLKENDAWLLSKITDRGRKVKTPVSPSAEAKPKDQLIERFQEVRNHTLNYTLNTQDNVRAHYGKSPYGPADVYQLLIVIGGHNMRHNAQIVETINDNQI